jgi:Galactose oxidase, central domain
MFGTSRGTLTRGRTTCTLVGGRSVLLAIVAALLGANATFAADVAGTARLIRERRSHTATALANGKILVAGGQNLSGVLSDVEIFDSATGTFTAAARLLTPRAEHTATRLADGRVLLIGGRGVEPLTSTEFYDATRNVFSAGPSLNSARFGHTATLLPDGRIVVIGGNAEGTAEIFDPRAGTFTALPCHLTEPRSFHAAVRLANGAILIAGGITRDGVTLKSAEILHPDTLECEPVATMFAARSRFVLRLLPDGKVQAIGGDAERTMELFNPAGYFSSLVHLAGTASSESAALRNAGRVAIIGATARPISDATATIGERGSVLPVQSLLDRIGHSVTEIPEAGLAIAAGGVSSAGRYQQTAVLFEASSATVTTDQTDYAPGQTVTITGTGWLPGETVSLNLHRDTNDPPDTVLTAVADANGDITNSDYVCQEFDLGITFLLTATGETSGYTAQTTFTDARQLDLTFAGSGSGSVTMTPSTGTVNAPVSCGGTGTAEASQTVTSTCSPNITFSDNGATVTFSATAAVGSVFAGWSGQNNLSSSTCTGTTNPCSAVLGGNPDLTVTFNGACDGKENGFVCRAATDLCDAAETCDGVSLFCPADALKPSGTVCRTGSGDLCDPDEACTGSSVACPADTVAPSTTVCNPGSGDVCDPDEKCTGVAGQACPSDTVAPNTTVCRTGSGDVCDPDELCTGVAGQACPADTFKNSSFVCRTGSGDLCDPDELCPGVADQGCPADTVAPSGTVCNPGSGDQCDPDEVCSGTAGEACPADTFKNSSFVCRTGSGDLCDPDELCPGVANAACPADTVALGGTTCRPAAGVCDKAEACTGVAGAACPTDAKKGAETTCRAAAPQCDIAEVCNGASNDCPADAFEPDGTGCIDSDICTLSDTCQAGICTSGATPNPACSGGICQGNAPPVVGPVTGPSSSPMPIGSTVASVSASFTDLNTTDTHTCVILWDDGAQSTGTVTESNGSGTCTRGPHTYTTAGVYTITVRVTDNHCTPTGASGDNYFQYVVIFDTNAGFVTGGGWINQPIDGYPALSGKANFGFVSKYKKGNNTPDGETEFQFKAGDINFHSSGYDYGSLVISGGKKATYRGDGTVNGEPGYQFVLIAVDGDAPPASGPDRFRIKITKDDMLFYDNRVGSSEDPDVSDTTALGGGSIVIHK